MRARPLVQSTSGKPPQILAKDRDRVITSTLSTAAAKRLREASWRKLAAQRSEPPQSLELGRPPMSCRWPAPAHRLRFGSDGRLFSRTPPRTEASHQFTGGHAPRVPGERQTMKEIKIAATLTVVWGYEIMPRPSSTAGATSPPWTNRPLNYSPFMQTFYSWAPWPRGAGPFWT